MLSASQRRLVLYVSAVCAFLFAWILAVSIQPAEQPALYRGALRFDAHAAMSVTKQFAQGYPDRVTGTPASRRAARFLQRTFESLGYRVAVQRFPLWFYGKRIMGENVIATLPGADLRRPYVAVLAHYDNARTMHQAAEDDGSGVGTILELARSARGRIAHPLFVATDAEEVGMLGARSLVAYLKAQGSGAALSIDYINAGATHAIQLSCTGQFGGYTPVTLRQIARDAAQSQGAAVASPFGLSEWIDRTVERSFQDQGPLLEAGIPAVNIGSIPDDVNAARDRYHTRADAYSNFEPASFTIVGRSAELVMYTLATGVNVRLRDGFMVSTRKYVIYEGLWLLLFLPLVPVLAAVMCYGYTLGVRPNLEAASNVLGMAISSLRFVWFFDFVGVLFIIALAVVFTPLILLTLIPLAAAIRLTPNKQWLAALHVPPFAAYVYIRQLVLHNVIPRFDLYPPPPKDPLLYHPSAVAVLGLLAILALGYGLLSLRRVPLFSKGVLLLWTAALALAAFAINPFGLWYYFGVFLCVSLFFIERTNRPATAANRLSIAADRLSIAANLLMLIASVVPFAFVIGYFANEIFVGPYIWWYLVLQAAYGTWSFWIVGAAVFAVVLWSQYLRLALSAELSEPRTISRIRPGAPRGLSPSH